MDVICFSHLRWNFVYQRPQHLLSRLAKQFRVFFIEEPVYSDDEPFLDNSLSKEGVWIVVPHLRGGGEEKDLSDQQKMLKEFFQYFKIEDYICWYYTPMASPLGAQLSPRLTVYDCMDELSAFKNAPPLLREREAALMEQADLVFTGGHSLYQAKKNRHDCIYPFPSSIDKKHFSKARNSMVDPSDQFDIPHPRIGFFGVIDERMDIDLLDQAAKAKPDWHFIVIGPTVKIDPATLPTHSNIHYLGGKSYAELPNYLAGWDVAMMPFAINESTKYISPTKTPEYLAGGKPVVSTPITDVVSPYGDKGLVYIAGTAEEFVTGIQLQLDMTNKEQWLLAVDNFLAADSWDNTVEKMIFHINTKLENDKPVSTKKEKVYV